MPVQSLNRKPRLGMALMSLCFRLCRVAVVTAALKMAISTPLARVAFGGLPQRTRRVSRTTGTWVLATRASARKAASRMTGIRFVAFKTDAVACSMLKVRSILDGAIFILFIDKHRRSLIWIK